MKTQSKVVIAVVGVVALVVAGSLYWFFRDDSPPEVSLENAVATVGTASSSGSSSGSGSPVDPDTVSGTWVVDSDTGEFDYESATGSFVGFRIEEELARVGSTTAVGRTGDITGSVVLDGMTLTSADFEIDLTTITTNESRRDDKVQRALNTGQHPNATFKLTEPIDLGDGVTEGKPVKVNATGDLTINGVTKSVEVPLEAQLTGETIVVVGSTDIVFSDFDVEVPSSQMVLSVEDHGTLELQLLLVRG